MLHAETALFGSLCPEPSPLGDGALNDPRQDYSWGKSAFFGGAEEKAVGRHRAGMVPDLAPTEAKFDMAAHLE